MYSKILLNFNDSISYDECGNNWNESGSVSLEEHLFSVPVAYFNGTESCLYLESEEISCESSVTYEFWIYLIEGHFGFTSNRAYRDDTVCICIGNEGIGFDTGITTYYPGLYVVSGSRESGLLSLNKWHYITISVDKFNNHFISIDGNIEYSGFNSRNYSLKFLPTQLGSTPTWAYGRSNIFPFKGFIKGFRVSSGIARYTNNFKCPEFPKAPGQEIGINISIPNSEKSGSYTGKNSITYYYKISFSKISNKDALVSVNYGKNLKEINANYSSSIIEFNFDNYMNSEVILLSKANSELTNLKNFFDSIIDEINLPEDSIVNYTSEITNINYSIRQNYYSVDNSISSCQIVLATYFKKDSSEIKFSQKVLSVNSDNYSQLNSNLLDLSESELNSCKQFLDTLIDKNILIPNAQYKNIKAKNGNIYYLRLTYSLGQVSDTLANINYKTSWGTTAEFKFTYSNKTFYIDSSNFTFYYSLLSKLGNNELLECAKMFENISSEKIIIKNDNITRSIITYSKPDSFGNYLGIFKNNDKRIFCKLMEENKIASKDDFLLAIKKDNKIYYISNDF